MSLQPKRFVTAEQQRNEDLTRIADALERIANRPRFVALSPGNVFSIDRILSVFVDRGGGTVRYSGDHYRLCAEDVKHLLAVLEQTGGDR